MLTNNNFIAIITAIYYFPNNIASPFVLEYADGFWWPRSCRYEERTNIRRHSQTRAVIS